MIPTLEDHRKEMQRLDEEQKRAIEEAEHQWRLEVSGAIVDLWHSGAKAPGMPLADAARLLSAGSWWHGMSVTTLRSRLTRNDGFVSSHKLVLRIERRNVDGQPRVFVVVDNLNDVI